MDQQHVRIFHQALIIEPAHEIMARFVLRKLILQTRMRSHPVGLDVWFLVGPFVYFHTSCVRTAKALARLRGCAGSPEPSLVAYVISTKISWAGSITDHINVILLSAIGKLTSSKLVLIQAGWLRLFRLKHLYMSHFKKTSMMSFQFRALSYYSGDDVISADGTCTCPHSSRLWWCQLHRNPAEQGQGHVKTGIRDMMSEAPGITPTVCMSSTFKN